MVTVLFIFSFESPLSTSFISLVLCLASFCEMHNYTHYTVFATQVGLEELGTQELSYRSLTAKLMKENSEPLIRAYGAIEETLNKVSTYVKVLLVDDTSVLSLLLIIDYLL